VSVGQELKGVGSEVSCGSGHLQRIVNSEARNPPATEKESGLAGGSESAARLSRP
jgi:hypothetical protein